MTRCQRSRTCIAIAAAAAIAGCGDPLSVRPDGEVRYWMVDADGAKTSGLILEAMVVFGTLDGAALALDRESGERVWRRSLAPTQVRGRGIHFAADRVLVPHYQLWALHPTTGSVDWTFGGPDGAAGARDPGVSGDTIFTASPFGWATSLDGATGQPHWSTDLGEALFPPTVSGELVIYATRGFFGAGEREGPLGAGHVVALRRSNGTEAWRLALPDSTGLPLSGGAVSSGAVWQDRLIVGGKAAWVYALRVSDGYLLWKAPNGESPQIGGYSAGPVVVGDVVVIPQANGLVDAWDPATGERRWQWEVPTGSIPVTTGPLVYTFNGPITVGDAQGSIRWQAGGHTAYGGSSYFEGNVAPDGTIYTLGVEHFAQGGGTFIYALKPPLR